MKQPTFLEGAMFGVLASVAGAGGYLAFNAIAYGTGQRGVVALLALAYVIYLVSRSRERVGRISTIGIWVLAAAVLWFLPIAWPLYLICHLALIWLTRTLYYHAHFTAAALDFGLLVLGGLAALWAMTQTQSLFLAFWSFFLVQALFVSLPKTLRAASVQKSREAGSDETFQRAYRNAQAAVRKLSSL